MVTGIDENKTLTLNFIEGDLDSFSPCSLAPYLRGRALGKWLFEGLTRLNPCGNYEPAGAQKIVMSPCQTRYLFTLRSARYSDGSVISAFDYEQAWKQCLLSSVECSQVELFYCLKNAKKAKKNKTFIDEVGVKALNDKTLLVELERPNAYFLNLLSSCLFVPYKVKSGNTLFSGPYQVEQWEKGQFLQLTKNPFFEAKNELSIHQIKILLLEDHEEIFSLYEAKELDWIGDPFSPIPEDMLSLELLTGKWIRKEIVRPFWIHLNTQHFPLSSPFIRRSLSYAIDRRWISEHIYPGCQPLFTPLPKALSLSRRGDHGYSDKSQGKKLFEQGLKELGISHSEFPILKIICCPIERSQKLAEYLKKKWEAVFDITVHLDIQDNRLFLKNLQEGNFQIGSCFVSSDYKDALTLLAQLAPAENCCHWNHAHYRDIVACIEKEKRIDLRNSLIRAAESILSQEMPVIGLLNQSLNYVHRDDLRHLVFDYTGVPDLLWAQLG